MVPVRIALAYKMCEIAEYHKFFSCQVLFNKDVNRIVLKKKDIATGILTSDQFMLQLFNSIVSDRQALLTANSTAGYLKQVLFMHFKVRIPPIEEAASSLNMTPRSLQRKLLQECTTFRDVAGEVRKEIPFQLMENPAISLFEISEILG